MQDYIRISQINDFIFCPFSIYLHGIYENFSEKTYHATYQTRGKIKHESIDTRKYSTSKNILQSLEVYSEKYRLTGKIDTLDVQSGTLVERKNKIVKIYDGYRYQLYAQYFCLSEMGYAVKKLALYSLSDNKKYSISVPHDENVKEFEAVLNKLRSFNAQGRLSKNPQKCEKCIYNNLCN